ncbi:asparaginase [Spelaeicoccus albus]|uniref:L-asparaginase II n=1 Tax=Spelaeicoccus albus TaxID=1280376 RepID=A0A7Z0D1E7_9MICO|nr:asparaginase [Spelaeicoccus albus]NYI66132.1 L-asparaginase II [Spelaeicoccus albus]
MSAHQTFSARDAVELAVVERSGFVESRHIGSAVVIDPAGDVRTALGDVDTPIFTRSSLKPLQALAALRAGAPLTGVQLALATASHRAQQKHVDVVASMLAGAGLSEDDLQCPADLPGNAEARNAVIRAGGETRRIYYNCSGKHAAFLWACAVNGWDTGSYLDPANPIQRLVADVTAEYAGAPAAAVGVDGCGAPVLALPLTGLARAISAVAVADEASGMVAAVMHDPWAIAGDGEPNSVVIERLGILAKGGAEGVMVMAAPDGTTVALKCLDGSARATTLAGLTLLARTGAVDADAVRSVLNETEMPVLGRGQKVGAVRPGSGLTGTSGAPEGSSRDS